MKSENVGFTLFISVFIAIGFGVFGWGIHSLMKSRRANKWPTVTAIIEACHFLGSPALRVGR